MTECRLAELCCKEIIDISDGTRYGFVGDAELDLENGQVRSLVVYGRLKLFGLLGREEDCVFPWTAVRRMGEDIILVDGNRLQRVQKNRNRRRTGRRSG